MTQLTNNKQPDEMKFFFDFDSTFIQSETLDDLAQILITQGKCEARVLDQIANITSQAMAGGLDFYQSLVARLALLPFEEADLHHLIEVLSDKISHSIAANQAWFLAHAKDTYIISGGFKEIIVPVVARFGIHADHVFANEFREGKLLEDNPLAYSNGKAQVIKELMSDKEGPVVLVGDGYTDYEVKEQGVADYFLAYAENVKRQSVISKADYVIHSFDDLQHALKELK